MARIKAPFNFVPLNNKAFYPDWADQISHDVPFKDGVSGSIKVEITAESPIFIRNGHTKKDSDGKNDEYTSFCKTPDGQFFIPGTSLKGCIRSVLEILSFGKMTRYQDSSFYIRDLSNSPDGKNYRDKIKPNSVHCGWMKKSGEHGYKLQDCGTPFRISERDIDNGLGLQSKGLDDFVRNGDFTKDSNKTAKRKYEIVKGKTLHSRFTEGEEKEGRKMVRFSPQGEISGTLVLTGQPGARKSKNGRMSGKYYEFVFRDAHNDSWMDIPVEVVKSFQSIHANSIDYVDFRKKQLESGESIPVFFTMKNNSDSIEGIGLTYMFKYPANHKISDGIPEDLKRGNPDMSECIFGYSSDEKSLRGRVQFSNALAKDGTAKEDAPVDYALSKPNPSYYPLYLGNGSTWNSDNVQIAGYKRYPVRNTIEENSGTEKMGSTSRPLGKGSKFEGEIRYFNLKPAELGALLAAITFDGHKECYHSLGSGKPLGYGKVKIECSLNDEKNEDVQHYIDAFKECLKGAGFSYDDYKEVNELFRMAEGIPEGRDSEFTYMKMSNNRQDNEFLKGKDAYAHGEQLGLFSQILQNSVPRATFQGNARAAQSNSQSQAQNQEKQDLAKAVKEMNSLLEKGDFAECRKLYDKANPLNRKFPNNDYEEIGHKLNEYEKNQAEIDRKNIIAEATNAQKIANDERKKKGLQGFLEEKTVDGSSYRVNDLKMVVNRISQWMKSTKEEHLNQEEVDGVFPTIKRISESNLKSDAKRALTNFGSKEWKQLTKIIGEEKAKEFFSKINVK